MLGFKDSLLNNKNSNEFAAADDFSREKVPQDKTYSGIHIALIIVGGTIGIPIFLMAAQIGGSLGLQRAAMAFSIGCLVLGSMGALTSYVGAKTRYSTYMLTEFAFGRNGAKLANFVVAAALIGWYGVISNVFGQAAHHVLNELYGISVSISATVIIGSLLMVGVSISGFKGIDKLALVLVPAMAGFMIYTVSLSYGSIQSWDIPTRVSEPLTFPLAVSAVIGSYIAGVIIQPDYSRFARNIQHAMWAVFIALGISFPIVQFLAAVPSVATGEQDLMAIMLSLGIGVPAFLLLLLGSWSSNVLNLYSSSLSLATIFTRVHLWQLTVVVGVIGTAIAFLQVQDYLVNYLILLGIAIPPIGSIYIVDVLFVRRGYCDDSALDREPGVDIRAFIAWFIASTAGYLASENIFTILGIASMDTILVASIVYAALKAPRIYEQWAAVKP